MEAQRMLTREEQEAMRQAAMNEPGTEPPCPFCGRARVLRSDYIRCLPCGINWLSEEMGLPDYLNLDPRVARARSAHTGSSTRPIVERQAADAE
jgi:predicted RNA-binding Zn-ribbon protein involved in translation (DUF1610 family)